MKKNILKIVSAIVFVIGMSYILSHPPKAHAQQMYTLTLNTTGGAGIYSVSTNPPLNILQVSVMTTNPAGVLVEFFDSVTNVPYRGTNNVIPAYVNKGQAQSNIVTSFIQYDTGITNWYTNAGIFTYYVTNAASTNVITPFLALNAGTIPTMFPTLINKTPYGYLCENGISVRTSGNASIVVYYNSGK